MICIISTEANPDCSTCVMPCRRSNVNRQGLTKLFSTYSNSYTITTILDGFDGNFKVLVSQNSTEYRVYSMKINVVYWSFSILCGFLADTPTIIHVENDSSQLKVRFPSFKIFPVYLESLDDPYTLLFYEKVSMLHKDLLVTKNELLTTQNDLNIKIKRLSNMETTLLETRNQLIKVMNDLNLLNKTLQKNQKIHKSCEGRNLSAVMANSQVYGPGWVCKPPGTNAIVNPTGSNYCEIHRNNYVYFDLRDVFIINTIKLRFWGSRIYHYTLDVLNARDVWISLAAGALGQYTEVHLLEEPIEVRKIRMTGRNEVTYYLILHSIVVDCV